MKKLISISIFIFISTLAYSQLQTDMVKYWFYRNRLQYFVVPGYKQGESQIIGIRNEIKVDDDKDPYDPTVNWQSKNADYGQHGKYTGLYLSVLATEYYLLNKNGQAVDAANTQDELYKALYAVRTI